jgi:transmembrane sensor
MTAPQRTRNLIAAEASEWFARVNDPSSTRADRQAFTEWLQQSPLHVEEYLLAIETWDALGQVRDIAAADLVTAALGQTETDNVVLLAPSQSPAESALHPRASMPRLTRVLAAGVAVVLLALTALWAVLREDGLLRVTTMVGEQRSVSLPDGSIVYVNTDSELTIELASDRRQVTLLHGEARFDVARDPHRPFIVSTPEARMQALGTVFNVRTLAARTDVTVVEGRVALQAGSDGRMSPSDPVTPMPDAIWQSASPIELAAGARAAVTAQGTILSGTGPSVSRVLAWSERRLVFRDESLAEVVREFNRYRTEKILIEDEGLAKVRLSGSFLANDPTALLDYLAKFEGVTVRREDEGVLVLDR